MLKLYYDSDCNYEVPNLNGTYRLKIYIPSDKTISYDMKLYAKNTGEYIMYNMVIAADSGKITTSVSKPILVSQEVTEIAVTRAISIGDETIDIFGITVTGDHLPIVPAKTEGINTISDIASLTIQNLAAVPIKYLEDSRENLMFKKFDKVFKPVKILKAHVKLSEKYENTIKMPKLNEEIII